MISLGVQYMITHANRPRSAHAWIGRRPHNDVPHLHAENLWVYEGGEAGRQARMRLVGIDELVHEEKRANYFKGGIWKLLPQEIKQIKLDEVAFFSLCPKIHADKITQNIVQCVGGRTKAKQMTITDGCAGVGGVSMSLIISNMFKHVISVELDPTRNEMLQSNMKAICRDGNTTSISVEHKNYLDVMKYLKQDIVFFDPPFGGPGYKYYKNAVLFLAGMHMADIANYLLTHTDTQTKHVFIRTPENFDEEYFKEKLSRNVICEKVIDLDTTDLYRVYKLE
jgi:16S rRNA G966 N2-methylase RsmD